MGNKVISKERWEFAIAGLTASSPIIAQILKHDNLKDHGKEHSEEFIADIELAIAAMKYVAEFATDKVIFVPLEDTDYEAALKKLKDMGVI